jgi:hypothetical protein
MSGGVLRRVWCSGEETEGGLAAANRPRQHLVSPQQRRGRIDRGQRPDWATSEPRWSETRYESSLSPEATSVIGRRAVGSTPTSRALARNNGP